MSLDNLWNNEKSPSENKAKDFNIIDISEIKQNYEIVHQIQEMELVDSEDNQVIIPSELQDYFPEEEWDKLEQFKNTLYEKLWLKPNLEENSEIEKFEKWFIDWLLIENIEMLDSLTDKSLDELVQMIKQLSNWEVIVAIVEDLYDSMWDILETFKEPYKWWLALWWFWLWVIWKWMKWLKVAEKLWDIKKNNLFDSKEYNLKTDETLDELLKRTDKNDIIWEWENWIIINNPADSDYVIKISKEWVFVDDIIEEYKSHEKYYKKYLKWLKKWELDENIKIPKIDKPLNSTWWYFFIEKIEWQNLFTKFHLDLYKDNKLSNYNINDLENLTDNQFLDILKKEKLSYAIPSMNIWDVWMWWWWTKIQVDLMMYTEKFKREKLWKTISYFKSEWLEHTDFHAWNIMIDKKGKNYIIDFGNINK